MPKPSFILAANTYNSDKIIRQEASNSVCEVFEQKVYRDLDALGCREVMVKVGIVATGGE